MHVAIVIPSCGARGLANLARDAIAAFTEDVSHEVWSLDHAGAHAGFGPRGSEAVGAALDLLLRGVGINATHVFVMHDDALPLRPGWLSYLLSKPGPVTGVKESEGTHCAHGSGVLYTRRFTLAHSLRPDLPRRDAGEWPANWVASSYCHRPGAHEWPHARQWWHPFSCDVSLDDAGEPLYVHFGGGTLNHRRDTAAWITAARHALHV